ncbi:Tfp pilus assembly protein PilN [Desulfocapsa sulfexigens DSM 10523]|uniref:Tfp pilus assembly protein PilN n=1 Tax=Desulfocapsa sulfexigens (strain DSM 10523 / SB164P1) TaxID=1167006 RepID=M1P1I8_DESSD|nr:PilN domain-containing protein [Desulfocapsa sulfexigens]AGF77373.1 Tfp pilus assembly protein PilN [Desulfocapsa sulfexigens DSM 10523]
MLRINLLPIRQLKKRAKARNQIISFLTLLIFLFLILGTVSFLQSTQIKNIESSIAELKREKQQYAPILAEMKKLEQTKKDLENKIGIIKKLRRDSAITVHILDEVAKKVDSKRMWLKSLKQQGANLSLTGVALDNQTIAQFMDALKDSPYISEVNLSNASLAKVSGRDLKSFSLACDIVSPPEESQKKAN